jgi:hypothetical protein
MEREEFVQQQVLLLKHRLTSMHYEEVAAKEIALLFVSDFSYFTPPIAPRGSLGLLVGTYAIRKDDLNLFEIVAKAAAAGSTTGFFASLDAALSAKITLLFAIFSTARELWNKGRFLDSESIRILSILKERIPTHTAPGMNTEEILRIFNLSQPNKDLIWLENTLQELRRIPMPGGSNKELVSELHGHWRSHI